MRDRPTMSNSNAASEQADIVEADVCLIVEGCYPYIAGGVSSWIDWLIKQQPERRFAVVAVVANDEPLTPCCEIPANVVVFQNVVLSPRLRRPTRLREPALRVAQVSELIYRVVGESDPDALDELSVLVNGTSRSKHPAYKSDGPAAVSFEQLLSSRFAWNLVVACYHRLTPHASFPDFFWAWRTLVGGLFAVLTTPIPAARVYHTISTGYAGLIAAHAAIRTGRPAAITEHGIYTNERRIDLLMAEWIADTIGPSLSQPDALSLIHI